MTNGFGRFLAGFIIVVSFTAGLSLIVHHGRSVESSTDLASREPAQAARVWTLGGYLPENPNQKVYVTMNGRTIVAVQVQKPQGFVLETESIIFPGLIDMHSHVKYNILPLWQLGKSQFLNRFEWRQKFPPYKQAVSFNMKPIKGDTTCAAVRWAEVKSLVGGATAIQGIGGDTKCASGFGVLNVEVPNELAPGKVRALTDLVSPDAIGSVYLPGIAPEVRKRQREWANMEDGGMRLRAVYDQSLANLLTQTGIMTWLDSFANRPRTLALGLKLTIGLDLPQLNDSSPATFERLLPQIQQYLVTQHKLEGNALAKQIASMRLWLYGKDGRSGYFSVPLPRQPLQGFQLIDDSKTMEYFGKAGVITVDRRVRRYLAMFETATRRSVLRSMDTNQVLAVIAHVAEGGRNDSYNRSEYPFAMEMGFTRPGLVMIHAVGLDRAQLEDAGRNRISVVWSPFSNLLLYGETLDVVTAKKARVNIAIGADWSPTGSKNIVDELKIARRYLNKARVPMNVINDRDLVDMATINAARALNIDRFVGRVAPNMMANLTLMDRRLLQTIPDPWSALVASGQEHLQLVVVAGEPLYGDMPLVQNFAQAARDQAMPEALPRVASAKCPFQKGIRMPWVSPYDKALQSKGAHLRSVAAIETELRSKMGAYAQAVRANEPRMVENLAWLDPLFTCEDDYYRNEFNRYIEVTLDLNIAQRQRVRQAYRLNDQWTPLRTPEAGDDSEDEKTDEGDM